MHVSDCKCCQALKYDGLVVEMTCEDGYVLKKQVAVPMECDCQICSGETISKSTKYGRKTPAKFNSRSGYSSEHGSEFDEVELLN